MRAFGILLLLTWLSLGTSRRLLSHQPAVDCVNLALGAYSDPVEFCPLHLANHLVPGIVSAPSSLTVAAYIETKDTAAAIGLSEDKAGQLEKTQTTLKDTFKSRVPIYDSVFAAILQERGEALEGLFKSQAKTLRTQAETFVQNVQNRKEAELDMAIEKINQRSQEVIDKITLAEREMESTVKQAKTNLSNLKVSSPQTFEVYAEKVLQDFNKTFTAQTEDLTQLSQSIVDEFMAEQNRMVEAHMKEVLKTTRTTGHENLGEVATQFTNRMDSATDSVEASLHELEQDLGLIDTYDVLADYKVGANSASAAVDSATEQQPPPVLATDSTVTGAP